jgi:hypothetical protein
MLLQPRQGMRPVRLPAEPVREQSHHGIDIIRPYFATLNHQAAPLSPIALANPILRDCISDVFINSGCENHGLMTTALRRAAVANPDGKRIVLVANP